VPSLICFSRVVASVTKDDANEVVPIQLRSTVTRKARVPANQVNIKSDGGTLTLAESTAMEPLLGLGTHNRFPPPPTERA
jgi:hypothetical protein